MNSKEYKLPDGRTALFFYDEDEIGKISLEAMDSIMSMITEKWIPVTERLPEKDGDYIVTYLWIGTYSGEAYRETGIDEWKKGGWIDIPQTYEVTAWIPLPKPYQEDSK